MTQSIGTITVKTDGAPVARVQSINYLATPGNYTVIAAGDVLFENSANNNSLLTYDNTTNKFVVQNAPRLNGGTF